MMAEQMPRILVVDDDLDSLRLIGMVLHNKGYEVVVAKDGLQALDKALSEELDMVILDVMMPGLSGYEVCRRLRADPRTADIPVLMFTAKSKVMDKVVGFECGADEYLTKPIRPAKLVELVQEMLARGRAAEPAGE
jgi:DNA-binding response OmpR family regulator